jgi:hypothetical protein
MSRTSEQVCVSLVGELFVQNRLAFRPQRGRSHSLGLSEALRATPQDSAVKLIDTKGVVQGYSRLNDTFGVENLFYPSVTQGIAEAAQPWAGRTTPLVSKTKTMNKSPTFRGIHPD